MGTEWGQRGDSRHSSGGTPTQHRLSPSPPAAVNGSTWGSAVGIGPGGGGGEELQIRRGGREASDPPPPSPHRMWGRASRAAQLRAANTQLTSAPRWGRRGGGEADRAPHSPHIHPTFTPQLPPPPNLPPPPPQPAPQRCVIIYCVSACGAARPRPHSAVGWGAEPPYEGPQRDTPPPHVPSCCGGAQP